MDQADSARYATVINTTASANTAASAPSMVYVTHSTLGDDYLVIRPLPPVPEDDSKG